MTPSGTFEKIFQIILERKQQGDTQNSYVARLMDKGLDSILKKVGEESAEVIIAAKNGTAKDCIHEVTDLWFHSMVLMVQLGLSLEDIAQEFEKRFGRSGLEEKASRGA
ncbi:MAG: phosphoribosyl-ATP diphosphatase [SAR324 cluster bacterium]|nr:phosphoribosyl-ATP diphosphatase [SAR324 cluster bacterium]